jgi:hypothetical protein
MARETVVRCLLRTLAKLGLGVPGGKGGSAGLRLFFFHVNDAIPDGVIAPEPVDEEP